MGNPLAGPVAELHRANAELAAARRAALNVMEDAILARDALRASEARQAYLLRLSDALRPLADPEQVKAAAAGVLGEQLAVNRAFYAEVEGDDWVVTRGYEAGVAPLPDGRYAAEAYGPWIMQTYRGGGRIVFRDTQTDPRFAAAERAAHAAAGIIGAVGVPLVKGGRLVAILAVHTATPRDWTAAEVGLVEETAERTWAAVERAQAVAALRESEEQFRRAIEEAPIPVLMQAEDGQVLQVSRTWTELTGYALSEMPTADAWLTKAYGPGADALRDHAHELFAGGRQSLDVEFVIRTRGGADRHWSFSASAPGRLRDGRRFLVGMAVDITARQQAEAALRASEARLRAVAANLPNGAAFLVDRDLRYVLAEGQALRDAGFTPADFEGKPLAAALPPALVAEYEPNYRRAFAGEPFRLEHVTHGRQFVTHGQPLRDAAGEVAAVLAVSYDVTDLRRAEDRLRLALAAARMGIWTLDAATATQTRDANLNRLLGRDGAESTQSFVEFLAHVHPDDRDRVRDAFYVSLRDRRPLSIEFRVVWPDGSVRWLRDQGDVFGDAAAGTRQMAGACVDVTERRAAEDAVRAGEERLRLILASATDYAILTLDADRTVTTWSPGAAATFGFAEADIVGRSADVLFTPEDRAAGVPEQEAATARRDGRAADERWHLRQDGTRFYASGVLTRKATGGFVNVLRDLTDRKRMEDALRDSHARLEQRVAERTADLAAAFDALEAEMGRRRAVTRRLSTAQEDERQRVSRDLHDTVGQTHAALGMALKAVADVLPAGTPAADRLAYARQLADEMGLELHAAATRLRPTALDDLGLEAALRGLAAAWSHRHGPPIDLYVDLGGLRPAAEVETALYRVVQEALTNVARHAHATAVSVMVTRSDGTVRAVVEDNGAGFNPAAVGDARLGLLGMRERASLLGGDVQIESAAGKGTTVIARIPAAAGE